MRYWTWAIATLLLTVAADAYAGKYNEVLSIGDKAPEWKDLLEVVSGKKHALADLKDAPVVVVVFTCNSCPVATDYEERILKLAEKYGARSKDEGQRTKDEGAAPSPRPSPDLPSAGARRGSDVTDGKVAVVAINVNKVKEDLPPAMKARAEKMKYPLPYLFDETQKIARDFGAIATPEFFVLDRERKVVYMGAMDDNSDAAVVKHNYLEAAVEAALAGKTLETTETPPSGCRIRYARERRTQNKN